MKIQNYIGNKHNGVQHVQALRVDKLLRERIKKERRGRDITLMKKMESLFKGLAEGKISRMHFK